MNYDIIIEKDGYRREDLNEEHQDILHWLDCASEEIENCTYRLDEYDDDIANKTLLGKIKEEFAEEIIECILDDLRTWIKGVQIQFADTEGADE